MIFSARKNEIQHTFIKWAIGLQFVGILINVVISVWETDIGFFSANTLFASTTTQLIATGLIAVYLKDTNFFLYFTVLSVFNFMYSLQPIKIWTDEGNLCDSLSAAEQQLGNDCYNAAIGAEGTSFANLITLVTQCYASNGILTSNSGVCYNIRWGQSQGSAIRAFEFISWLAQFLGTLISVLCGAIEIASNGKIEKLKHEMFTQNNDLVEALSKDFANRMFSNEQTSQFADGIQIQTDKFTATYDSLKKYFPEHNK